MKRLVPLYGRNPIGLGTPLVESLASFIGRLAVARHLMPSAIAADLIYPLAPEESRGARFWRGRLNWIYGLMPDGHGELTQEFVSVLCELTGRDDLSFHTLLPWRRLCSRRRGGALYLADRRWCACCLAEWRAGGIEPWEPLFWRVAVVRRCPVHCVPLSDRCPGCDGMQGTTSGIVPFGICRKCGRNLEIGDRRRRKSARQLTSSVARGEWQVSHIIGRFLARQEELAEHASSEGFVTLLERARRRFDLGTVAALSRCIGVRDSTVHKWRKGQVSWEFRTFLHVCLRMGADPLAVAVFPHREFSIAEKLNGQNPGLVVRVRKAPFNGSAPCQHWDPSKWKQVERRLTDMLRDPENGKLTLKEISKSLGISVGTLGNRFPNEFLEIKRLRAAYRERKRKRHLEEFEKTLRKALAECVDRGLHPRQDLVFRAAGLSPQSGMSDDFRPVWRKIRDEYDSGEWARI